MNTEHFLQWCRDFPLSSSQKPLIMGILNVTPNSFYDGGLFLAEDMACKRAMEMLQQGVDIIDIGGESSRPGAETISEVEEIARVVPIIQRIRDVSDVCISIDTCKPKVMDAAVSAGASFINDIKALTHLGALETAARLRAPVCLMHMKGLPKSMQDKPYYAGDVIDEINDFFNQLIDVCLAAGIEPNQLILDPGFGFGKTVEHNLLMVKGLQAFKCHHLPLLLGVSRKSTIGAVLGQATQRLLAGSIAANVYAMLQGVSIIRTHDVEETKQALQMVQAICNVNHDKTRGSDQHEST